jgi:hypothetical protein
MSVVPKDKLTMASLVRDIELWEIAVEAQKFEMNIDDMAPEDVEKERWELQKRREELLRRGR